MCGVVNPLQVNRTKELDDNSPTKNDVKDARVIAQLVNDGRYAVPSLPQDVEIFVFVGTQMPQMTASIERRSKIQNFV